MENCFVVKVCVLGQASVGKTSLALRFAQNSFRPEASSTVGASFLSRNITMDDGSVYKLQIWDTAGQEKYRSLTPLYYRGAAIILVVYDVTNEQSMMKGVRDWVHELRVNGPDDAVLVLVGNKRDKENVLREVDEDEAKQYADKIGALFFEASAKTGENVMNIFITACSSLNKNKVLAFFSNSNGVKNENSSSTTNSKTTWYTATSNGNKSNHATPSRSISVEDDSKVENQSCCKS